jgi:hypothetical protein
MYLRACDEKQAASQQTRAPEDKTNLCSKTNGPAQGVIAARQSGWETHASSPANDASSGIIASAQSSCQAPYVQKEALSPIVRHQKHAISFFSPLSDRFLNGPSPLHLTATFVFCFSCHQPSTGGRFSSKGPSLVSAYFPPGPVRAKCPRLLGCCQRSRALSVKAYCVDI